MRSALPSLLLLTAPVFAFGAGSLANECFDGANGLAEGLSCLKKAEENSVGECPTPTHGWTNPVVGNRILGFGDRTQFGASSKGIVFEASRGAQVQAPVAGRVLYAGEFRSYGKMIILSTCDYDVMLAGPARHSVKKSEKVAAGHRLGQMSDDPKEAPAFYLEVRHDGRVINPNDFFK